MRRNNEKISTKYKSGAYRNYFDADWNLLDLQISSIDILEEEAFDKLAAEIKANVVAALPMEIIKLNHREAQVEEFIRAKIRKMVYKATDIKPVTYMHFFKQKSPDELAAIDAQADKS